MCIFAAHMICYDDDLEDIAVDRLTVFGGEQTSRDTVKEVRVQSILVLVWFGGNVEGDPTVGFFEGGYPDILHVHWPCPSAHSQRRRSIGIVQGETEVDADFLDMVVNELVRRLPPTTNLNGNLSGELYRDVMRLRTI
jgi:hypothetical protein